MNFLDVEYLDLSTKIGEIANFSFSVKYFPHNSRIFTRTNKERKVCIFQFIINVLYIFQIIDKIII